MQQKGCHESTKNAGEGPKISCTLNINLQEIKKNSLNQPNKTFHFFYGINHSRILFGIHTDIN